MQATTLLIAEKGAHWIVQALAWRARATEAVVALIQDKTESSRTFRARVERRIDALRRKGVWLEQIILLSRRSRGGSPHAGKMLRVIQRALAACAPPLQVLLVPKAPALVATVCWELLAPISAISVHACEPQVQP